jgi:hypothetical protein
MRFAAGILLKISYMPSSGRQTSVRHQKEGRYIAAPLEGQLRRQNPGPRIRTSAWRERDNRPNLMQHVGRGERCPAAEAVAHDAHGRRLEPRFGQDIVEKKANIRNAARDGSFGSRGPLFRSFTFPTLELGCDEFGVIQSRDDVAMAGQVIRQKCEPSRTASATRMREKDDRANSDRFRWTPHVAREAAVAASVERLHTPLGDSESAPDKWVVHQLVNDTCSPQNDAVACARRRKGTLTFASGNRIRRWLMRVDGIRNGNAVW